MTLEELKATNEIASGEASKALSKMVSYPVSCEPRGFGAQAPSSMLEIIESDTRVAFLDAFIVGQISGRAYQVFPNETAFLLEGMLLKKSGGV